MYPLAASQFKKFVETYPTNARAPEALFMAGEAYFKAENFQLAQQAYLEMTIRFSDAPKADKAQMKIGDCHKALGDFPKAANAYQRVKVFYPKSMSAPIAMIESARMFAAANDLTEAIKTYYEYVDAYPQAQNVFAVKLEMLDALLKKGELQRAMTESEKLIASAVQPGNKASARYFKGLIHEEMGQIQEAQDAYHAVIGKSTDKTLLARTNLRLGHIYRLKGEWQRSNEFFAQALASQGDPRGDNGNESDARE